MGMIMKDGIPYGGIYPIDDAPTQGSNNAVKSGGVFSSLSNKVDKVAGKGLSTNDYDNTEKGKVADNASAIEAIVNVNGCCNIGGHNAESHSQFGVTWVVNSNGTLTVSGGTDINNWGNAESTILNRLKGGVKYILSSGLPATSGVFIQLRDSNNADLVNTYQHEDGKVEYTPLTDMDVKLYFVVHPNYQIATTETIYPMLYDARLNPSGYIPYSMSNSELTNRVTWKHLGYGADDGGEVATSIKYSEFMFTMNIADINIMQSIIVPRDQIYHAIYLLAYQDTVHHGQTRIDFNSSLSKFTFQREFLNGWNTVRIDVYGR